MTRSAPLPDPATTFDGFLYAKIGDDGNGMRLSVLSALARLDIDPWQEAASLASLPGPSAVERLTGLIAALPDERSSHRDPASISTRLVALLPHGGGSGGSKSIAPALGEAFDARTSLRMSVITVLFVAFMLGAQWLATIQQAPEPVPGTVASTARATVPVPPTAPFGQ